MGVLVVEDEEVARENFSAELRHAGMAVTAVANGASALRVLKEGSERFEALVTDLYLGDGVHGATIAAEMQRRYPRARIVVMTGRHDLLDIRWREHGWVLLAKPFPAKRLVATLTAE